MVGRRSPLPEGGPPDNSLTGSPGTAKKGRVSTEAAPASDSLPPATAEQPASPSLKQTPLHAAHVRLGGKMVGFGGWSMPVQYPSGILAEHRAVRTAAGVFDISHMGQFIVSGAGGKAWLNTLFTNNLGRISAGQSQYGFLLNEQGGVIDDLIIYEYAEGEFLLVVNASKIDEDFAWLQSHLPPPDTEGDTGIELANRSDRFAALAVQGPHAAQIFAVFFGPDAVCPRAFRRARARPRRPDLPRRAHRLHRRGRLRVVFSRPRLGGGLGRTPPDWRGCRPHSLRPRLARQPAVGSLLPAQRLRSVTHAHPARCRSGRLRGPGKTRLHRARRSPQAKSRRRPHRAAGGVPHDGQESPAPRRTTPSTRTAQRSARRPAAASLPVWKQASAWLICPSNSPRLAPR